MAIDFYDFFSGCGGTSRGMQDAGMTVRLGLDCDSDAKSTYEKNFKDAGFLCRDIRSVSVEDVLPFIAKRTERVLVFGACAPCQPFSRQTRNKNLEDGRRGLLAELHRFIEAFLPEYIFVENVPGLQSIEDESGPFVEFKRLLNRLDYFLDHKIVMAYHYGVPQRRRRLVLLGSRLGSIDIPPRTHGPGTECPKLPTVWEWISHLPAIEAGETHQEIANHRAANLSDLNLERITATPIGGDRRDWPEHLRLACHEKHFGHTDVYGRMVKTLPSAALTTRCISLSNGRFGHPTQNRAISVREAACIQTFPMDFVFEGSLSSVARQVGNAVPVAMAKVFGDHVMSHYSALKARRAA